MMLKTTTISQVILEVKDLPKVLQHIIGSYAQPTGEDNRLFLQEQDNIIATAQKVRDKILQDAIADLRTDPSRNGPLRIIPMIEVRDFYTRQTSIGYILINTLGEYLISLLNDITPLGIESCPQMTWELLGADNCEGKDYKILCSTSEYVKSCITLLFTTGRDMKLYEKSREKCQTLMMSIL